MKKALLLAAIVLAPLLAAPAGAPVALAQGAQQSVTLIRVDPVAAATGFRVSKVRGSSVVNDGNDAIGTVDDIIISSDGKTAYAILSVGGFLGLGTHLVAVPYESLNITPERVLLPGGTKDQLKALPEFKYATK